MLDQAEQGCETSSAAVAPPVSPKPNWFSDLTLTRRGLFVAKSGRRIGLNEITPAELIKFCAYLTVVLAQGMWIKLFRPSGLSVWFMPDRPRPWYVVWSAMTLSGTRYAKSPDSADVAFYFEDTTTGKPATAPGAVLLNGQCTDISKTRVAEIFEHVAGYSLAIDPETFTGAAIEKSEQNGVHDGRFVTCPTKRQRGKSYQRFIEASNGTTAVDLRTTIIDRKPQFVLVKTKPA